MRLRGEMRDGCNKYVMHGEMNSRHKSRFNKMKKKRNTKDGMKIES
jgi:hypothetical protein